MQRNSGWRQAPVSSGLGVARRLISVPVEFLSDEQVAAYGRFDGVPSRAELERFFLLDDADRRRVDPHRGAHHRLGYALQLGTVRFLGTFLDDPLDVPWAVVEYLAQQLGVPDASVVKDYAERIKTPYEHRWEITQANGYRQLETERVAAELRGFLAARAWTRPERPTVLFDQAVAWLRTKKVLLPGVSVLARLVAEVRAEAGDRLHVLLAGKVTPELGRRLEGLLVVAPGERSSDLDRLRQAPTRASGPQMVRALDRAAEVTAVGSGQLDFSDVPPGRPEGLARPGLTANAAMLRRLPQVRRTATLLATVRTLQVAAVDDALDLFAVLMATPLIGPAERASTKDQLRSLPALRKASATLAITARMLLDLASGAGDGPAVLDAGAWSQLRAPCPESAWPPRWPRSRGWSRAPTRTPTPGSGRNW